MNSDQLADFDASQLSLELVDKSDSNQYQLVQDIRVSMHIVPEEDVKLLPMRDEISDIYVLYLNGEAIGSSRIEPAELGFKLDRIVIVKSKQKSGYGRWLVEETIRKLSGKIHSNQLIYLDSIVTAVGFYKKLGFECVGAEFNEADHVRVQRMVASPELRKRILGESKVLEKSFQ